MRIGMRHQLVGLLARGVEAQRVVDVIVHRERHRGVGAVDGAGTGVDQVLHAVVPAALQDVAETDQVGVDIGRRVLQRVAHPGLGRQVHHPLRAMLAKHPVHRRAVGDVLANLGIARVVLRARQARLFQRDIVIVVEVVNANDLVAALQQAQGEGTANKTGTAGDQDSHGRIMCLMPMLSRWGPGQPAVGGQPSGRWGRAWLPIAQGAELLQRETG